MDKILDIMSEPLAVVSPECSISKAVQLLLEEDARCLMVATESGRLVGFINETSLLPSVYDSQMRNDPVSLHMKRDFVAVSPQMTVEEAINQFVIHRVDGFPVVDQQKMVGWISRRDILKVGTRKPVVSFDLGASPSSNTVNG